jgi:uncharacterized zinc-type alcohol dehydrogenase-like protein
MVGYSSHIVVDENYVLRIPDSLSLDVAAPLLCAGITVFSPLACWSAAPGKKVGIIGMGGLGHVAVQIAHAMGAEVNVLSQSLRKQDDAVRLGADHYYATSDPETFATLAGSFDLIVNTVSANLPLDEYLGLLKVDGTLVHVGAGEPERLQLVLLDHGAPEHGRFPDRRHPADPGNARLLCRARSRCADRGHHS